MRYKVLTVDEAQALWDAGCQHSLRRTFTGELDQWRDAEDANNSPYSIYDRYEGFRWRIPIE